MLENWKWGNRNSPLEGKKWKQLWKLKIKERLQLFLWKVAWQTVPTKVVIGKIINFEEKLRIFSDVKEETLENLFIECPIAKIIWVNSPCPSDFLK